MRHKSCKYNRFNNMTRYNALFIADCSQIHSRVPAKNKRNIITKTSGRFLVDRSEAALSQQLIEPRTRATHAWATEASTRGGCQASAASVNAAKMARENALWS